MPGLYRSPGLADIDVCAGKRQAGSEALIRTRKRYQEENEQLTELMERPRRSVTLPLSGDYGEGGMYEHDCGEDGREDREHAQDVETSDGSMHEGYGERRVEETGMPPTPPDAATNDEVSAGIFFTRSMGHRSMVSALLGVHTIRAFESEAFQALFCTEHVVMNID